jgi:hypothetical protein
MLRNHTCRLSSIDELDHRVRKEPTGPRALQRTDVVYQLETLCGQSSGREIMVRISLPLAVLRSKLRPVWASTLTFQPCRSASV